MVHAIITSHEVPVIRCGNCGVILSKKTKCFDMCKCGDQIILWQISKNTKKSVEKPHKVFQKSTPIGSLTVTL